MYFDWSVPSTPLVSNSTKMLTVGIRGQAYSEFTGPVEFHNNEKAVEMPWYNETMS